MTVPSEDSRVSYNGAGSVGPFDIPFYFLADADIRAVQVVIATGAETALTLTTDYTLTGAADPDGGQLTLVTALPVTDKLVIIRDPDLLQSTDLIPNDDLPAESLERMVDKLTMLAQRTRSITTRSLRQPDGDADTIDELPAKLTRASSFLYFDADGNPTAAAGTTETPVSAAMEDVVAAATLALARDALGLGDLAVLDTVDTAQIDDDAVTRAKVVAEVLSPRSIGRNITGQNNATNPNYQFDWDADEFVVQDSNGKSIRLTSVDVTVDITASGANGLDTDSEANSTWYYGHIIYNPTTDTVAGLLSTSWTAPTLPSGYTFSAPIGAVYNNGSGNLASITQSGSDMQYRTAQTALSGGTSTSEASVSVAAIVPPVADYYTIFMPQIAITADGGGNFNIDWSIRAISGEQVNSGLFVGTGTATAGWNTSSNELRIRNVSQQFYYDLGIGAGSSPNFNVQVLSYTLPIGGQ